MLLPFLRDVEDDLGDLACLLLGELYLLAQLEISVDAPILHPPGKDILTSPTADKSAPSMNIDERITFCNFFETCDLVA